MIDITLFLGDQRNTTKDRDYHFESIADMSEIFTKCNEGGKHFAYFTRGLCDGTRKDVNVAESSILIVDGDCNKKGGNAPSPRSVHIKLKDLGINHFIYTTHSHNKKQNKFRCVVECDKTFDKSDLKFNNKRLLRLIKKDIKHVTEMDTWSQPWFVASRDDPTDGLFRSFVYYDGGAFGIKKAPKQKESSDGTVQAASSEGKTHVDKMEEVRVGKNYHDNIKSTAWGMLKDAQKVGTLEASMPFVSSLIKTMMENSRSAGDERWQARYDDIDRLIKQTADKLKAEAAISDDEDEEFSLDDLEVYDPEDSAVPKPPGLLGQLYEEYLNMMRYKDDKIAFVTAMFTVSSIAGRKFNVDLHDKEGYTDPTALNMYFTLAASTGVGKDQMKMLINRVCIQSNGNIMSDPSSFFFTGRNNSLRPLYRMYKDQRSIGLLNGEIGISAQSTLGDTQGMKKFFLDIYSQGHWDAKTDGVGYGSEDDSIPQVKSVALSKLSESTEIELFKAYNMSDVMKNGLVPRESVFRVVNPCLVPNSNKLRKFSPEITKKIGSLAAKCSVDVNNDDPETFIIHAVSPAILKDAVETQQKYRKLQFEGETEHIKAMASRMFVKCVRYAGLAVVMNREKGADDALIINAKEWGWAKRMVEFEVATIASCFDGMHGTNEMNQAIFEVYIKMKAILDDSIKNKRARVTEKCMQHKIIPVSKLKEALKNTPAIKSLDGNPKHNNYQSGFDKVTKYMEMQGAIKVLDKNPLGGAAKCVKVTSDINEFIRSV